MSLPPVLPTFQLFCPCLPTFWQRNWNESVLRALSSRLGESIKTEFFNWTRISPFTTGIQWIKMKAKNEKEIQTFQLWTSHRFILYIPLEKGKKRVVCLKIYHHHQHHHQALLSVRIFMWIKHSTYTEHRSTTSRILVKRRKALVGTPNRIVLLLILLWWDKTDVLVSNSVSI